MRIVLMEEEKVTGKKEHIVIKSKIERWSLSLQADAINVDIFSLDWSIVTCFKLQLWKISKIATLIVENGKYKI